MDIGLSPYETARAYADVVGAPPSTIYFWVEAGYGRRANIELDRKVRFCERRRTTPPGRALRTPQARPRLLLGVSLRRSGLRGGDELHREQVRRKAGEPTDNEVELADEDGLDAIFGEDLSAACLGLNRSPFTPRKTAATMRQPRTGEPGFSARGSTTASSAFAPVKKSQ